MIIISGTGAPLAGPIITLIEYCTQAQDLAEAIQLKMSAITAPELAATTGIPEAHFATFNTLLNGAVTALNATSITNLQKNLL